MKTLLIALSLIILSLGQLPAASGMTYSDKSPKRTEYYREMIFQARHYSVKNDRRRVCVYANLAVLLKQDNEELELARNFMRNNNCSDARK